MVVRIGVSSGSVAAITSSFLSHKHFAAYNKGQRYFIILALLLTLLIEMVACIKLRKFTYKLQTS